MLKSKIHRATVTDGDPRVVHVDARNQILAIDDEVATLLTPPSEPATPVPVA